MKNKVVFIAGPTAGGKSGLALWLAERANGTVINADSMQVYAELRVITARPAPEDEARAPHKLYGYRQAADPISAAEWAAHARAAISATIAEGRLPIVVGGTGLYFRTLIDGIAEVPPIPGAIRAEVRTLVETEAPPIPHEMLRREDPAMADRLNPGDRQRIARALEVKRATGRSLLDWQRDAHASGLAADPSLELIKTLLMPPRDEIYARADARFRAMIDDQGALAEVAALDRLGLDPGLPAMKALGVPELTRYLRGELDRDAAIVRAQTVTRRYAKRQYTWFRNQFSDWVQADAQFLKRLFAKIFPFINY
ncbi:MAG: tRNA (adenosine(37)-N6)-dimethylallyltransferase MiaA [Alphaproteobacteria bacterium]|nr:MAG: tRNA (adenosine(37)-N6)-dimethylallyltransferase MiaA [Alphaproteobacteria bacterium]